MNKKLIGIMAILLLFFPITTSVIGANSERGLNILPGKINGGFIVKATLDNSGDENITDINWSITIKGGLLNRVNFTTRGTIELLEAQASALLFTKGIIVGFGKVTITVSATASGVEEVSETIQGFLFLIYIYTMPILD